MEDNKNEKLFNEFPPISVAQWEEQIIKDLKGADYEKRLIWNSIEGLKVKPYYTNENIENKSHVNTNPGNHPFIRGFYNEAKSWLICEEIYLSTPELANKQAVDALKKGAESINFIIQDKIHTNVSDALKTLADIEKLFENIDLRKVQINFVSGCNTASIISLVEEYLNKKDISGAETNFRFDFDPIGHLTVNGNYFFPEDTLFNQTASLLKYANSFMPNSKVLGINAYLFGNAGATIVQELAYALSIANEYLIHVNNAGLSFCDISKSMRFNFGVGSNYFMEIAKFRAFRWLWTKIIEQYVTESCDCIIPEVHGITIDWNKTAYDVNTNMLRTTTEAMAAVIGGVDAFTVRPYDVILKSPNEISKRIARNLQLLLKEEAWLDKVADVSGGSYYIENLTESIAEQAWKLFLEIEDKGGYINAFKNEEIQKAIEETSQKRDMNIALKQEILLGTNQYPDFNEKISEKASSCSMNPVNPSGGKEIVRPIKLYRGARAFEVLRLETEKMNKRPDVFMLTYGNLTMRKARAGFATNFFGCAGYKIIDNLGFETVQNGIKAAINSKAEIVVICSSDDEYPEIVPEIVKELKDKAIIVLAGYPKDHVDNFKALGLEYFIHVKTNLIESLNKFQQIIKTKLS